jgi:hypothetical protein
MRVSLKMRRTGGVGLSSRSATWPLRRLTQFFNATSAPNPAQSTYPVSERSMLMCFTPEGKVPQSVDLKDCESALPSCGNPLTFNVSPEWQIFISLAFTVHEEMFPEQGSLAFIPNTKVGQPLQPARSRGGFGRPQPAHDKLVRHLDGCS